MKPTSIIEFSYDELKLLKDIGSSNSNIKGFYVSEDGVVVTDGRRLVVIDKKYDKSYAGLRAAVDFKFLKSDSVSLHLSKRIWRIVPEHGKIREIKMPAEISLRPYPKYKWILEQVEGNPVVYRIAFDTRFIPDGYRLIAEFSKLGTDPIKCTIKHFDSKSEHRFILMPMKLEDDKAGLLKFKER